MSQQKSAKLAWLGLFGTTVLALALVLTPAWLIQPFRAQTTDSLKLSLWLRSWSPIITPAILILTIGLAIRISRASQRRLAQLVLVLIVLVQVGLVWLARQNHFEWMFPQINSPAYCKVDEASFLTEQDTVMAIKVGQDAVAYPIRQMAYHHVLTDIVGGTPVVVTY